MDPRPARYDSDSDVESILPETTSVETSSTEGTTTTDDTEPPLKVSTLAPQRHDFHRWRPRNHILAPHGWMNDPCAPGYDSSSGLYHISFQWNPKGNSWGNLSWGSAQSPNLVDWTVSPSPSIAPTETQDKCGVFTGCILPRPMREPETPMPKLTAFYTSAQKLPISYRLPYIRGSEQLAMATSLDIGKAWTRARDHIILSGSPPNLDVTGWRDPFVGEWEALDKLIAADGERWLYGTLSGGLRQRTPTVFLYRIDPRQPTDWIFLSPLVELFLNYPSSRWSGDFGINWEVANFMTLHDEGVKREILVTSAEGTVGRPEAGDLSKDHRQMWMCGHLVKTETGEPRMDYRYGGVLDHGSFYAGNGFWDPQTGQFVTMGWVFEEDLPQPLVERQGWSGCLSIPRVVNLTTWKGVTGTLRSALGELSCFEDQVERDGTHTLRTVSAIPDPRLQRLRARQIFDTRGHERLMMFPTASCTQWELALDFSVSNGTARLGFDILHSDGDDGGGGGCRPHTRVSFDPHAETLAIDRSSSSTATAAGDQGITTASTIAPHTLFTFTDGRREELTLHVLYDVSVLEVFANDRTAITTRVYAPEAGACRGIRIFIDQDGQDDTAEAVAPPQECARAAATRSCVRRCDIWELRGSIEYPRVVE